MKSTLRDVYLYRDDAPSLVEQYEECFKVEQDLRMDYYHFVFIETSSRIKFIHTEGSTEPIQELKRNFQLRSEQLNNPIIEELCFMIATYRLDCLIEEINLTIPNPAIKDEIIPESVHELIQPTHGYLIYREQGVSFYQLATGCDERRARIWVAGARVKKRVVLDNIKNLNIDGIPSTYLDMLFPLNGGLPYLIRKPDHVAHELLEYLQSK